EARVLEGVSVALLDERLVLGRRQLGDDPPVVAPSLEVLVGVLHPDDGNLLPPGLLDEAPDVRDDRVAVVCLRHDAVLDVDDEQGGVRPVVERAHDPPFSACWTRGDGRYRSRTCDLVRVKHALYRLS